MVDWDQDQFMSSWDKKYCATNVKPGANPYDRSVFLQVNSDLARLPELESTSYAIITVISCALGRGDVVGRFFDDITSGVPLEASQEIFSRIREAITIVYPFLGMPNCVPACYGMIGVVERKGAEFAISRQIRKPTVDEEDIQQGQELRARIYHGVGNTAIFQRMEMYFTDLFNCSTNITWGYLVAKANEEIFELTQCHLIIVSAIAALGATRQTRSHIKATVGIGNKVDTVKRVLGAVFRLSQWAGKSFVMPDIDLLAQQISISLPLDPEAQSHQPPPTPMNLGVVVARAT